MAARLWVASQSLEQFFCFHIFTYPHSKCNRAALIAYYHVAPVLFFIQLSHSHESNTTWPCLLLLACYYYVVFLYIIVNLISSAWLEHENILTSYFVILWYIKYMIRDRGYGQPQNITSIGWFLVVWLTGYPAIGRYCCIMIIVLYIKTLVESS